MESILADDTFARLDTSTLRLPITKDREEISPLNVPAGCARMLF